MKVVSISHQRSGPACQSYLIVEALKRLGVDAVDINVADCYVKGPYQYGMWDLQPGQDKEIEDHVKSADLFLLHNFDPRVELWGPAEDRWRPTYPLLIPGYKELRIPLNRRNVVWKLHGTDAVKHGGYIHGYEHRHGQHHQ